MESAVATAHLVEPWQLAEIFTNTSGQIVLGLGGVCADKEFAWNALNHLWDIEKVLGLRPAQTCKHTHLQLLFTYGIMVKALLACGTVQP